MMGAVPVAAAYALASGTREVVTGPAFRSASILKPLLFWAAADRCEHWHALAEQGIVVSDNDAMVMVWEQVGADVLLDVLAARLGHRWRTEPGGVRSWGRVLVRAEEVAAGYAALTAAADGGDRAARDVLAWMRAVPPRQSFGLREVVAEALPADPATVGVKCGWFGYPDEGALRTHGVTVTGSLVTAVLTALPYPAAAHPAYLERYDSTGGEVCDIHDELAGATVREMTRQLVCAARAA
jgi:hypothetical protein